jgi:hypothetical protein
VPSIAGLNEPSVGAKDLGRIMGRPTVSSPRQLASAGTAYMSAA